MKVVLKDFEYQGYYFKEVEFDLPDIKKLDDVTTDMIVEEIVWPLEQEIDWNESFGIKGS